MDAVLVTDSEQPRTLGFAVWSGDIDLARELLAEGALVDEYGSPTDDDLTPLMEAVSEIESFFDDTRIALTELLLANRADVAKRDRSGRSALHYAVGGGRRAVELLLASGADPNAADAGGVTPLHEAITRENVSAVAALRRAGARVDARTSEGKTPADLLAAVSEGMDREERAAMRAALEAG